MAEIEGRVSPFDIFSPHMRERVIGLTHIGYIEKSVEFCGHSFSLKTLRPAEKAAVANAVQEWIDTPAYPEMWAAGHVGMALTAVDGDDSFCPPIGPNINDFAKARLKFLTDKDSGWFQPVIDYLHNFYLLMEKEVFEAIGELQDLASGSQQSSQPFADSLIEQALSPSETNSEPQPSEPSSLNL